MKGNVRCEAHLENGKKLVVYASDESEGEDMLIKLAKFTKFNLVYPIDVRSHRGTNKRVNYNLTKTPTRQYLASVLICNWDKLTKFEEQLGALPAGSKRKSQTVRLKMHYDKKPAFWDRELNEALSNSVNTP